MNKKIVFVFRSFASGGAQKIEAFVANALADTGYSVFALNMTNQKSNIKLNKNIKIIDVFYDRVEKCKNKYLQFLLKIFYLLRIRLKILTLKPDLICSFLSDVVRITVLACKGLNIPIIGSERGDPGDYTQKQFDSYKNSYTQCAGVVFQLYNVAKTYNLPSNIPQIVIPNPCISKFGIFKKRNYDGSRIIVGAGRLSMQKRFDILIKAFELVVKKHKDYKLYIFGDGPLKKDLKNYIDKSFCKDSIYLLGDVENVFENPNYMEMFVLSSDFEGIPNVLLEALASGIPCISTDCRPGGARYLLRDGQFGLITPCQNVDLLARAICNYIENPKQRECFAKLGFNSVSKFEPNQIKKEWLNFLNKWL